MSKQQKFLVDIEIDKLTNSIENTVSGDVFNPDILKLSSKDTKIMGLIKEPVNVNFSTLDKHWTEEEKKEFSAIIKMRKEQYKKKQSKKATERKRATA